MKRLTYDDLKERSGRRVARKLHQLINGYDGSARCVREILRGLVAASELDMDVSPFVRELSKRARRFQDVGHPKKRSKIAI